MPWSLLRRGLTFLTCLVSRVTFCLFLSVTPPLSCARTEVGMGVRAWARGCSVVVLLMCSEAAYGVLGSHQRVAMKF